MEFDLTFADQDLRGTYQLTVGPDVTDVDGNSMNQDGDGIPGEDADRYVGEVEFAGTVLAPPDPPETILYSEDFESWPPMPTHWEYTTTFNGNIQLLETGGHDDTKRLRFQPDTGTSNNQSATLLFDLSAHAGTEDLYLEFFAEPFYPGYMTLYPELSNDGTNWETLPGLASPPNDYQRYVVDIGTPSCQLDDRVARIPCSSSASPESLLLDVYAQFVAGRRTSGRRRLGRTQSPFPHAHVPR